MKKVVITGGHMTPALAVAQILKDHGWQITYVGRIYALEGDKTISQEFKTVTKLGYKFIPIITGRLQRKLTRFTIISLFKLPLGFLQSISIILNERPQVVLSFGGYVALPIAISAWAFGIPIVTHEQTKAPGLSNKIIGRLAKKICISWKEMANFPRSKTIYTGNPLRSELFNFDKKLPIKISHPLLYITGGSLGAHSINILVEEIVDELLEKFWVIHQCGESEMYNDFNRLENLKSKLSFSKRERYHVYTFIDQEYIGWLMQEADLILTRAGANILTEIIALQKLALFIPLPWAGENEQQKNAQFLVSKGAAFMLNQERLTSDKLLNEINNLWQKRKTIYESLRNLKTLILPNADERVADVVESIS